MGGASRDHYIVYDVKASNDKQRNKESETIKPEAPKARPLDCF